VEEGVKVDTLHLLGRALDEMVDQVVAVVTGVLEEQVLLVKVMMVEHPPRPVVEVVVEAVVLEVRAQMVHQALEVLGVLVWLLR
jgi:hypothetical protein